MDITDAVEPVVDGTVLTGANLADFIHWVTNPINHSYRPQQLESFMNLLARNFMPATMIPNKDRRSMYATLQQDKDLYGEKPSTSTAQNQP
ncbi:hypothetical protein RvY_02353 [Ramazzottius varieornatus]|uniref:Uncharacterized protein n=1 Tax=Ramazzottius varieornatus TaxID=947166 RepID=A0A1D1UK73_RAMVA|nr:hypothetical protein RvY_02353 [Ramazzottius varieornatus]